MKKIISLLLVAALALALVGCANPFEKKPTAESLMENAVNAMEGYSSVKIRETMDFDMGIDFLGQSTTMGLAADLEGEASEKVTHVVGKITVDTDGEKQVSEVDMYTEYNKDDKTVTEYTKDEDSGWIKYGEDVESFENAILQPEPLKEIVLAEETEQFADRECYKVSGKLEWEQAKDLISSIQGMEEFMSSTPEDVADFNAEYYFDKATKELVGIKVEGKEAFEAIINSAMEQEIGFSIGIKVTTFEVVVTIVEKSNSEIKIPEKIVNEAAEIDITSYYGGDDYEWEEGTEENPEDGFGGEIAVAPEFTASENDLDVTAYSFETYGAMNYIMVIHNNSENAVRLSVNGVARDAENNMLAVDDAEIVVIGAGQDGICGLYFDSEGIDHVDTEFSVTPAAYNIDMVSDFSYEQNINGDKVLLAVTNNSEQSADNVDVYALFFDAEGNLVGWDVEYLYDADYEFKAGKTMNAQLESLDVEFDHVEIYFCAYRAEY